MLTLMPKANRSSPTSLVCLFGWEVIFDTFERYDKFSQAVKDYPNFEGRDWAFGVGDRIVVAVGEAFVAVIGVVGDFDASPELVQRLFDTIKHLMAKVGCVPKKIIISKGCCVRDRGHLFVGDDEWVVYPPAFIAFHRGDAMLFLPATAVKWGNSTFPDVSENG